VKIVEERRYVHPNAIARRYHLKRLNIVAGKIRLVTKDSMNLTFLDVGCGDGTYESILEKDFCYLVGSDLTLSNLKMAKRRIDEKSKVDFVLADAKHLPFRSLSVDVLLCSEVLEHLHEPIEALAELLRVFNGVILITVPVLNITRRIRLIRHVSRLDQIETQVGHVSMHEWSSWKISVCKLIENRKCKCDIAITHVYVSAEPFTSLLANYRNKTILRVLDKALNVTEKALSNPAFANHLMITLTKQQ
jgi:ubiquinone/menaquinone biosynthesis C-methylase UbiE